MARLGDKKAKEELNMLETIRSILEKMEPIRRHAKNLDPEVLDYAKRNLFLLTAKPLMYVANVSELDLPEGNEFSKRVFEYAKEEGSPAVLICAKLEEELIGLEPEEKEELLKSYGLEEPGLNKLIREAYKLLDLITFFTAGEKEARAWTVKKRHKGSTSSRQNTL